MEMRYLGCSISVESTYRQYLDKPWAADGIYKDVEEDWPELSLETQISLTQGAHVNSTLSIFQVYD